MNRYQHFEDETPQTGAAKVHPDQVERGYQPPVQQVTLSKFEQDVIPPNFDKALDHQKAWSVGIEVTAKKGKPFKVCSCCARPVERRKLKLSCNPKSLSFLGSGFPLFFDFYKYCIIILLILFVTSGDYNIITNIAYGNDCEYARDPTEGSNRNFCQLNWVTQASLANKRNDDTLVNIQQMLNLISILVIIVLLQYFRKAQRELDLECDERSVTASDYTIHIKNIPILNNENEEKDLLQFMRTYLEENIPVSDEVKKAEKIRKITDHTYKPLKRIVCVNLCYRLSETLEKEQAKEELIAKKQEVLNDLYKQGTEPDDPSIQMTENKWYVNQRLNEIQEKINQIDYQLDVLEERFHQGRDVAMYFIGQAFITFQWQMDRDAMLEKNSTTGWTRFFGGTSELKYNDQFLVVEEAPDPTDVFWENLHITTQQKIIRRSVGYAASAFVLLACSCLIYYLSTLQADNVLANQKIAQSGGKAKGQLGIKFLAYLASILIIVINYVLSYIIKRVSDYEGFSTQTGYNISVATLSGIAQFSNSALITFFINTLVLKNTFGSGGLIYNQTYVFLSNAIIPSVIELVDMGGLWKIYCQWKEKKLGVRSVKTQLQANKLFEKPEQDMSARYANILKTMFLTAFYASIIPLGIIISSIGLIITYWVQKYNILRRRTVRFSISSELSIEMTENLELVLPIYCFTNFWFEYQFSGGSQISSFACIGIVIGILNAVLPMQDFNVAIFPLKEKIPEHKPYLEEEINLPTDFPRENPCTRQRARDHYKKRADKLAAEAAAKQTML